MRRDGLQGHSTSFGCMVLILFVVGRDQHNRPSLYIKHSRTKIACWRFVDMFGFL